MFKTKRKCRKPRETRGRFNIGISIHHCPKDFKNRSASEIYRAIHGLYEQFPQDTFKTYTIDQGKEFACYSKVEANLKIPVYFADSYLSGQRGSNENANDLLREFFPKEDRLSTSHRKRG